MEHSSTVHNPMSRFVDEGPNPTGICLCGCGQPANIATVTDRKHFKVKGKPCRYRHGHGHFRLSPVDWLVDPNTDCWVWQRGRDSGGYGQVPDGKTTKRAHRVVYERLRGPIPDGCDLHHTCANKACVNPDHLLPMTETAHMRQELGKLTPDGAAMIRRRAARLMEHYGWTVCQCSAYLRGDYGVSAWTTYEVIKGTKWAPEGGANV